ncbi:MAG: hypothetical protein AAF211_22415 [Myxococcota bacterium]
MTKNPDPPRGPEVRAALLDAAVERYASGEPFSVRAVAALARVNLGQIHHVFGGKEGLRKAMLHRLAEGLDARLADLPPDASLDDLVRTLWTAAIEDPRFVRVLARQLVEHPDEPVLQSEFPVSRRLERSLVEAGVADARLRLAHLLTAGLGLALFGPWIQKALELDESDLLRVDERVRTIWEA